MFGMQELLMRFENYIKDKKLFSNSDKLLLAFSGGIDSVCLADLLLKLGYKPDLVHVNFNLRGKDADADQKFCEQYAKDCNLNIHTVSFDTQTFAQEHKFSLEEAARKLRYDEFHRLSKIHNYTGILTAHHADDNIETCLINLTAGTGIRGISAMKPVNGLVVRPLLFASRADIVNYCNTNKLKYCIDKSNNDERFIRNKIRHKVVPVLKEINPAFVETSVRTFENLLEVQMLYNQAINHAKEKVCIQKSEVLFIDIKALEQMPAARSILYEILFPLGFSVSTISDVFRSIHAESGRRFYSAEYILVKNRDFFELRINNINEISPVLINSVSSSQWQQLDLQVELLPVNQVMKKHYKKNIALFDFEKLEFPLEYRAVKDGDKFRPLGMRGKKLLSNYFIDNKFSYFQKKEARVLCSNGEIVWLLGERLADNYKITSKTSLVLKVEQLKIC